MPTWATTGKVALRPKGYLLTEAAYVVSIPDGRDTVELIETQSVELNILRSHVVSQDVLIYAISQEADSLKAAHLAERNAWESELKKIEKKNERLKSPWAIGFFGGYDTLHREFSVGVGFCFSVIRF